MKPQPMSAETVAEIWVENGSDAEDAEGFARAIIAARDAQWAAMIGEPVAWNLAGGRTFMDKPFTNRTGAELMASQRNDGSTVSPLYAIKETP